MKPILLLTPLALAFSAHAQSVALTHKLFVTVPSLAPAANHSGWLSESDGLDDHVAFRLPSTTGTHSSIRTLLFVHVTIHETENPPVTVEALTQSYPFLRAASATAQAAAQYTGARLSSTSHPTCEIPLDRLQPHLNTALTNLTAFGPQGSANATVLTWLRPGVTSGDEREPWPLAWANRTTSVSNLARIALAGACYRAAGSNSATGAAALNHLLQNDYVYNVIVQGVQVAPAASPTPPEIRFTQTVRMTRFTLKQDAGDPWFLAHGPLRWLPSIAHTDLRYFHVAGKGEEFHVQLLDNIAPPEGTEIVAMIPVQGGGWSTTVRTSNLVQGYDDMCIFPVPATAVSGFYYVGYRPIGNLTAPVVPIAVNRAYEAIAGNHYGVMVLAFQP